MLIYQFMSNGSLADLLYSKFESLLIVCSVRSTCQEHVGTKIQLSDPLMISEPCLYRLWYQTVIHYPALVRSRERSIELGRTASNCY